jgi:hypothetical protein
MRFRPAGEWISTARAKREANPRRAIARRVPPPMRRSPSATALAGMDTERRLERRRGDVERDRAVGLAVDELADERIGRRAHLVRRPCATIRPSGDEVQVASTILSDSYIVG